MADTPLGVAEATKRWTEHVSAAMQRQIDLALHARDRVATGDPLALTDLTTHLSSVVTALATDTWTSAGLLAEIAKSVAAESTGAAAAS